VGYEQREERIAARREKQRRKEKVDLHHAVSCDCGDDYHHKDSRMSKYHRAKMFATWLTTGPLAPYFAGEEGMVLDVAGGRGALAFTLAAQHGVRSATVDPRGFQLDKRQHTWIRDGGKNAPPKDTPRREEEEKEEDEDEEEEETVDIFEMNYEEPPEPPAGGQPVEEEATGKEGVLEQPLGKTLEELYYLKEWFDADTGSKGFEGRHEEMMKGVKCIVGLHPDQATEPIVDLAIRRGLPFAIVPCCVFARQFPDRRLQDGGYVETYAEFVKYLREKSPTTEVAELKMDGRCVVVYSKGAAQPH